MLAQKAIISASYFSLSHERITEVSSPPEYAKTIFIIGNKEGKPLKRQWFWSSAGKSKRPGNHFPGLLKFDLSEISWWFRRAVCVCPAALSRSVFPEPCLNDSYRRRTCRPK